MIVEWRNFSSNTSLGIVCAMKRDSSYISKAVFIELFLPQSWISASRQFDESGVGSSCQ
jgi:hypothetical protein